MGDFFFFHPQIPSDREMWGFGAENPSRRANFIEDCLTVGKELESLHTLRSFCSHSHSPPVCSELGEGPHLRAEGSVHIPGRKDPALPVRFSL